MAGKNNILQSYCVKCKRHTVGANPKLATTSNGRKMVKSTCTVCGSGKSLFVSGKTGNGLFDFVSGLF